MNVALWIAASVLALAFAAAGLMKLTRPKEALAGSQPWTEDFSAGTIKLIGALEVLGAIGLILPGITGIAPILVPLAATGLAIIMVLAAITHIRRHEASNVIANVVLLALAVFVAWGRFGPYAF